MLSRSSDAGKAQWQERRGDAAFISGDIRQARALYDTSLEGHAHPASIWLKLSDVCFRLGDLEQERAFRQRVYGALRER
jgi:tetratricopeptide (TPR) repeat protein